MIVSYRERLPMEVPSVRVILSADILPEFVENSIGGSSVCRLVGKFCQRLERHIMVKRHQHLDEARKAEINITIINSAFQQ